MGDECVKFELLKVLKYAVENKISDIHLKIGFPPYIRKTGKIYKTNFENITSEMMDNVLEQTLPAVLKPSYKNKFDLDYSFELKNIARFRINLSRELSKINLVIRVVPYVIPTVEELSLPSYLKDLINANSGIVLITGATGMGKSTTIASLLELINTTQQKHIITLEDPIEFVYQNKKSIITQRQIGADTSNFADGLKFALRQDPDVILIGEIRDKDSLDNALRASETGHLVFATIHTVDTQQTINRLLNMYEPKDREILRSQLSVNIRAIVSQKLLPTLNSQRKPACELLVNTPTIADLIVKDKISDIYELIKNNTFENMFTMNMSLLKMVNECIIDKDVARNYSNDKNELEQLFRGVIRNNTTWEKDATK